MRYVVSIFNGFDTDDYYVSANSREEAIAMAREEASYNMLSYPKLSDVVAVIEPSR